MSRSIFASPGSDGYVFCNTVALWLERQHTPEVADEIDWELRALTLQARVDRLEEVLRETLGKLEGA